MELSTNPFKPGAGRVPPVLAGRSDLMSEFRTRLYQARETGEGERPWILSGLRGVGKTVLLNQLGRDAAELIDLHQSRGIEQQAPGRRAG